MKDYLMVIATLLTTLLLTSMFADYVVDLSHTVNEAEDLSAQLSSDLRLLSLYQESCASLAQDSSHRHQSYKSVRELMSANVDRLRVRLELIDQFPFFARPFLDSYSSATLQLEFEKADSFEAWLSRTGLEFLQCDVRGGI